MIIKKDADRRPFLLSIFTDYYHFVNTWFINDSNSR